MKYLILLLFPIILSSQGLSWQNFMYEESGINYYVLPQQNAMKLDLLARKGLVLDSVTQIMVNKLESFAASNRFVNDKLMEMRGNFGKSSIETKKLNHNYNILYRENDMLRNDVAKWKEKYKKARGQRNWLIGGVGGTTLLIVLIMAL